MEPAASREPGRPAVQETWMFPRSPWRVTRRSTLASRAAVDKGEEHRRKEVRREEARR